MCLYTGRPKNINFSFETNGKLMALGVPILKHFRVSQVIKETDSICFSHSCLQRHVRANSIDTDHTVSYKQTDLSLTHFNNLPPATKILLKGKEKPKLKGGKLHRKIRPSTQSHPSLGRATRLKVHSEEVKPTVKTGKPEVDLTAPGGGGGGGGGSPKH